MYMHWRREETLKQYEGQHGCREYIAAEHRVCMAPETCTINGRMYCDAHKPVLAVLDAYMSGICKRCNRPRTICQPIIDNGGRCSIRTSPWVPIGKHGAHRIWMRTLDGDLIYNVMREGVTPTEGSGGYFSIASALRVRGMSYDNEGSEGARA